MLKDGKKRTWALEMQSVRGSCDEWVGGQHRQGWGDYRAIGRLARNGAAANVLESCHPARRPSDEVLGDSHDSWYVRRGLLPAAPFSRPGNRRRRLAATGLLQRLNRTTRRIGVSAAVALAAAVCALVPAHAQNARGLQSAAAVPLPRATHRFLRGEARHDQAGWIGRARVGDREHRHGADDGVAGGRCRGCAWRRPRDAGRDDDLYVVGGVHAHEDCDGDCRGDDSHSGISRHGDTD